MRALAISVFLFLLLSACGGGSMSNPHSSVAIDSAAAAGRRDASALADSNATAMEREAALLMIKHKEAHMRALGYDRAADAYMDAAAQVIPDSITSTEP